MKFTNGYWLIRPNFQMQYATQAVRVEKRPDALHVLSACRPIHHRGDTLDGGTLDVTFTAPRENIIRVTVTHFAGKRDNAPHFETCEEPVNARHRGKRRDGFLHQRQADGPGTEGRKLAGGLSGGWQGADQQRLPGHGPGAGIRTPARPT